MPIKIEIIKQPVFISSPLVDPNEQSSGRPLRDFGIGPYQKDENRPQNRTQIGPKIGLIFYKTLKIGPI